MSYDLEFKQLNAFLNSIDLVTFSQNWEGRIRELFEFIASANREFNLTRISAFNDFLFKHIADSLLLAQIIPQIKTSHWTLQI